MRIGKRHQTGTTLIASAALALGACSKTLPAFAPADPASAEAAVSRFESILASGGPLYELSDGRCKLWTVSAPDSSMSHVVGDGRTLVYDTSYDAHRRTLHLRGPSTAFDEPPPSDEPGWSFIGSGNYCTLEVQATGAPDGQAIHFGDRRWFFSREPCELASRPPAARKLARSPMCHDQKLS